MFSAPIFLLDLWYTSESGTLMKFFTTMTSTSMQPFHGSFLATALSTECHSLICFFYCFVFQRVFEFLMFFCIFSVRNVSVSELFFMSTYFLRTAPQASWTTSSTPVFLHPHCLCFHSGLRQLIYTLIKNTYFGILTLAPLSAHTEGTIHLHILSP